MRFSVGLALSRYLIPTVLPFRPPSAPPPPPYYIRTHESTSRFYCLSVHTISVYLNFLCAMSSGTPQSLSRATSDAKFESTSNRRVVYDQFVFFGDSITQIDGNPEIGFSCRSALQYGTPCISRKLCDANSLSFKRLHAASRHRQSWF